MAFASKVWRFLSPLVPDIFVPKIAVWGRLGQEMAGPDIEW